MIDNNKEQLPKYYNSTSQLTGRFNLKSTNKVSKTKTTMAVSISKDFLNLSISGFI